MLVQRREVLIGGFLAAVWFEMDCSSLARVSPGAHGCVIDANEIRQHIKNDADVVLKLNGTEPIIPSSGNPIFDRALANTLLMLSNAFDALPDFGYVQEWENDEDGRIISNAVAVPVSVRQSRNPDGTVLFGRQLLQELLKSIEHPEVAVTAVCAHEWGHIVQFKRKLRERLLYNSPTVKPLELHADFLAGYFAGLRRKAMPNYPAAVVALTQYRVGDTFIDNPEHHGTREERGAAVVAGFETSYTNSKPIDEALEIGINLARSKI
jgi:hypothetical protein